VNPISMDVLRAAREACDRHGALLVFDEVQTGMGRTGTLWAWQGLDVRPDVMTAAKGLGGGLPIGACVTVPEYADVLRPGDHGSTFAGGPLIARGALAVLDVVEDPELLASVLERGEQLVAGLDDLGLEGVRGRGLMLAFEHPDALALVRRALLEHRLVVNATGPSTVRLVPALTLTAEEADEGLERLAAALAG